MTWKHCTVGVLDTEIHLNISCFFIDIIKRNKFCSLNFLALVFIFLENNGEVANILLLLLILHGTVIAALIKRNILCL